MPATFDCIVLGLGGIGSATLAALARRGVRVLGIDRFSPPHEYGSSHGETRVIRRAYPEHPDYVPLVDRAFRQWRELESETGRELLTRTGLLLTGPRDGDTIDGSLRAAAQHQLDIVEIPRGETRDRFPHLRFEGDEATIYEQDAGFLRVEDCVQANLEAAAAHGAEQKFGETVLNWSASEAGVRVNTDRGDYSAGRLIVTAGAWATRLLSDLGVPFTVRRKVLLWHPVDESARDAFASGPTYMFERAGGVFYGFPCLDGATVKLALHTGGEETTDPDQIDRQLHQSDVEPVANALVPRLAGVDPAPARHTVCMYTMSPDHNFIIDRHSRFSSVTLAAGLSGHGFKFAPTLAEALTHLSLEGRSDLPINFLSLARFAV